MKKFVTIVYKYFKCFIGNKKQGILPCFCVKNLYLLYDYCSVVVSSLSIRPNFSSFLIIALLTLPNELNSP